VALVGGVDKLLQLGFVEMLLNDHVVRDGAILVP